MLPHTYVWRSQRTIYKARLSLSTKWVSRIELRMLGLVAGISSPLRNLANALHHYETEWVASVAKSDL